MLIFLECWIFPPPGGLILLMVFGSGWLRHRNTHCIVGVRAGVTAKVGGGNQGLLPELRGPPWRGRTTPRSGPLLRLSGETWYVPVLPAPTPAQNRPPPWRWARGNLVTVGGTSGLPPPGTVSLPTAVSTPGSRPGNGFRDNGLANPQSLGNLCAQTPP